MKATLTVLAMLVAISQAKAQSIQYDEATNTVVENKAPIAAPIVSAPVTVVQAVPVAAPAPQQAPMAQPQSTSQSTAVTVVTSAPVSAAPTAQSLGMQPQVIEQPTTVVEDQPVKDSRQELLKKARGQMEDHTERKIEEKIEEARIRDEKKRADRLNNAIDQSETQPPAALVAPVAPVAAAPIVVVPEVIQPAAPLVVAPNAQAVVIPEAKVKEVKEVKIEKKEVEEVKLDSADEVRPVVREELRSDMSRRDERKESKSEFYIGALGGVADYPSATNLKANGSAGVEVGFITANRIVIEGAFAYSSFDLQQDNNYSYSNYLPYKDLSQYNMTVALKYQILPGTFRPFAGVVAGYTQRSYSQAQNYGGYYGGNSSTQDASTSAIDYGLTAGLDVAVTPNFLVGVDFRYMTNLSNHVDNAYQQARTNASMYGYATNTTPVEELDYYSAGITAKLLF